jgi:hypothetical protein
MNHEGDNNRGKERSHRLTDIGFPGGVALEKRELKHLPFWSKDVTQLSPLAKGEKAVISLAFFSPSFSTRNRAGEDSFVLLFCKNRQGPISFFR